MTIGTNAVQVAQTVGELLSQDPRISLGEIIVYICSVYVYLRIFPR